MNVWDYYNKIPDFEERSKIMEYHYKVGVLNDGDLYDYACIDTQKLNQSFTKKEILLIMKNSQGV